MKTVLITGGFDPVHSGHIAYIREAKTLGDRLVVGVNSDDWLVRKKGFALLSLDERFTLLLNIKDVDEVIVFDDSEGHSIKAIEKVRTLYPNDEIIFANGGDRVKGNVPEETVPGVTFAYGVGGEFKMNSSSDIVGNLRKTQRPWGWYKVLHECKGTKVKLLHIKPHSALSMQRHKHRSELHFYPNNHSLQLVPSNSWHQLKNPTDYPLEIVEIQYGTCCDESDIERKE